MNSSRLIQLRLRAKKTQTEVANFLGITYQAYAHYEKGRREPSPEQLLKLADYFGVSIDYLLGRQEPTPEERAAGASATRKESITPIEDEMLYVLREIGKYFGEQAQRDYITVGKNMLKLK